MTRDPARKPPRSDGGFILIEILVSTLVLVIASAGVVMVLQTTVRSQASERHATEAYSLAQEDQARLATMRVEELWSLNETRTITLNQTQFKVHSTGAAINDITSAPSCGEGTYKVNYVQVSSAVTWPGMSSDEKTRIVSKLSPSKGSISPGQGSLAVSVTNQAQAPMPGVEVSGGNGLIHGVTEATGCAIFPNLPAGTYTLTASGEAAGLVNPEGKSSESKSISVVGGDTRREIFQFDRPGAIPVEFKYRVGSEEKFLPSSADSVVVNHSLMSAARVFGTPGGTRLSMVEASKLFPFSSAYTVYAGSCASNNPDPSGKGENPGAILSTTAPAGAKATPIVLQLPAFDPTVWTGKNEANKGSSFPNADVWIRDTTCTQGGQLVTRRYTTNTLGKLNDLGLPWGTYTVCVDTEPGIKTSGVRRQVIENVSVKQLKSATTREFFLGSGSGSKSEEKSCS